MEECTGSFGGIYGGKKRDGKKKICFFMSNYLRKQLFYQGRQVELSKVERRWRKFYVYGGV